MWRRIKRFLKRIRGHRSTKRKSEVKEMPRKEQLAPTWYKIALGEMGQKEIVGERHNPRIIEYHSTCQYHYDTDEVPWCSSFVNWCMDQVDVKRTGSASARSWSDWGIETKRPMVGDVVVFGKPGSWKGHVGFFVEENKKSVCVLGGNQGNEVNKTWYKKNRRFLKLVGYRTLKK